jgi:hypothetical protein
VAEAASVQGQDGVPVRNGLGDPRAKPRRPEVVPVHVGVTPEATAGSARDDVAAKLRELIFKGLRMDVARHVPRLARRLGQHAYAWGRVGRPNRAWRTYPVFWWQGALVHRAGVTFVPPRLGDCCSGPRCAVSGGRRSASLS